MTRKLFQKYDEETEQWLLEDIRDWPGEKFETEADEGDVELPGLDGPGFEKTRPFSVPWDEPFKTIIFGVAKFLLSFFCVYKILKLKIRTKNDASFRQ